MVDIVVKTMMKKLRKIKRHLATSHQDCGDILEVATHQLRPYSTQLRWSTWVKNSLEDFIVTLGLFRKGPSRQAPVN
jgi:hypothetical protein